MSNLPQDTEEFLFNPGLSSFSSDAEPSITSREQRSEIRALKSEMAQQSQLLTSLSTQLSKLVDIFAATPPAGEPQTPVHSPPERRISQVFSPSHGTAAILPGQSITVMSTKLAESAPILSTFTLYDVILYTRAYIDWTIRAGPNTVPPSFCTGATPRGHFGNGLHGTADAVPRHRPFKHSRCPEIIKQIFSRLRTHVSVSRRTPGSQRPPVGFKKLF